MSFPNCKIEIYDTTNTLDQTVTSDIIDCSVKDIVTSAVGAFSFSLPAKKGFTYVYDDIGNNYKVKIFFGYDGSYTHLYSGKIQQITTNIGKQQTRLFEGKALGEILERRQKKNKRWQDTAANTIISDIATDLGLSSNIDGDTTEETITVNTETYFDILKKVSDYWYDGSTQVQKDFWVDKNGVLQWRGRPLRTAGVETFTYGVDFLNYTLKYDILSSKNRITVNGSASAPQPKDQDSLTDSLTHYSALSGSLSLSSTTPKAGTNWIVCTVDAVTKIGSFSRSLEPIDPPIITLRNINSLRFWHRIALSNADVATVYLYAPDSSNYYYSIDGAISKTAGDHWNDLPLGEKAEYNATENATGKWNSVGSPNWWNIHDYAFLFHDIGGGIGDLQVGIDKLSFYPERWTYTVNDSTNQTAYELREVEYTDENLLSESECQNRAEILSYQLASRILRLDFIVPGNTNVLLGDRLTLTLPPDGVTSTAFDVVSVDHHFTRTKTGKYLTTVHAVDTANTRLLPPFTLMDSIRAQLTRSREVQAEIYSRIVR